MAGLWWRPISRPPKPSYVPSGPLRKAFAAPCPGMTRVAQAGLATVGGSWGEPEGWPGERALVTYPVLGPASWRSWVLTCCRLALGGGCGGLSLASIVCYHLEVAVGRLSKSHAWKGCPVKARPPSVSGLRAVELRTLHGTSRPSSPFQRGSLRPGSDRLSQRGSKAGWAGFRAACHQQGCGAASCH